MSRSTSAAPTNVRGERCPRGRSRVATAGRRRERPAGRGRRAVPAHLHRAAALSCRADAPRRSSRSHRSRRASRWRPCRDGRGRSRRRAGCRRRRDTRDAVGSIAAAMTGAVTRYCGEAVGVDAEHEVAGLERELPKLQRHQVVVAEIGLPRALVERPGAGVVFGSSAAAARAPSCAQASACASPVMAA